MKALALQFTVQEAIKILCAGISFYRRHTLGEVQEEDEDSSETIALLRQSSTLIFVLLAAVESRANGLADAAAPARVLRARGLRPACGTGCSRPRGLPS